MKPRVPARARLVLPLALVVALAAGAPGQVPGPKGLQLESSFRTSTLVGAAFPGSEIGYGLAGGVRHVWPVGLSLAGGVVYDEPNGQYSSDDARRHLETFGPYAEARFQRPGMATVRPYVGLRVGAKTVRSEVDADADGSGVTGGLVVGTEVWPRERVALRLSGAVSAFRISGFRGDAGTAASAWSVEAGLAVFLGNARRDGDGDGVADGVDACPDTPVGADVTPEGCLPDRDGDGRPDLRDACPDTEPGLPVDDRGCALDGDGDGVPDGRDRCPDTEPGMPVGGEGCVTDADGDGVVDRLDACAGTPSGSPVGPRGCRPDEDGDGVPDGEDRCPATLPDREADAQGCTDVQAGLRSGRYSMSGFPFRSDAIQVDERLERNLEQVGRELRRDSALRLEIRVHSDSVGPAPYNRELTRRLAETAREYLLRRYPVAPDRVEAVGLGEEPPAGEQAPRSRLVFVIRGRGGGDTP